MAINARSVDAPAVSRDEIDISLPPLLLGLLEWPIAFACGLLAGRALALGLLVAGLQRGGELLRAGGSLLLGAAGDADLCGLVDLQPVLSEEFCRHREFARAEVSVRCQCRVFALR